MKKAAAPPSSDTTPNAGRVSSPASTGGAGNIFEQHVDTYWLAQLLVGSIPPILLDCVVTEVHLQTEHLGWHTDDFLVIGNASGGTHRKLAGQAKRTFTVSAADEECRKAISDFWLDFKNQNPFSIATDRFALVTLRGTDSLLEHFSGLLDCSRASRDAADFEHRLTTPGFISTKAVSYCNEIRSIVGGIENKVISLAEIWPFLRVLHVLSLDLSSQTRQTEAMIQSLLALTTTEADPIAAADASWNALLRVIGDGMPVARSFQRNDLPESVRQRHSSVSGTELRALSALNDHSTLILDGIQSTIGGNLHLSRSQQVQKVLEQLESAQIVLVSGPAGGGKSGIAKDVINILAKDHFAFSFRAEEFACPHFDGTLQNAQVPTSAAKLGAILAGQGRKILLIESVERLLEKSTREAFSDLLTLARKDPSWKIILTCRDYSIDLVRIGLIEPTRASHIVVPITPLDDAELQEVSLAHPKLARPLAHATLRSLLRNPYFLDKALQINWPEQEAQPLSEREFRARFWREIVRAEHNTASGLPRRRETAFVDIAVRRAKALTLYAPCGDLDEQATAALRRDSLVVSSRDDDRLMAPAHDVLEDWAILHWLDQLHSAPNASALTLSVAIGTHPAIRRTYRKWVSELVGRDSAAADLLFNAALSQEQIPAQFRDDTLVALLRSPNSAALLERHRAELFEHNKTILKRIIHLLRVACVTTPAWLDTPDAFPSLYNVPDGPAWGCVLTLVQTQIQSFAEEDTLLLLGLIEDWARGVSPQAPAPPGAVSAAAIAHWLLAFFDNYRSEDQRKRTLSVIAKIPKADQERFTRLLREGRTSETRNRISEDFRELILEGLEGLPAARDLPDVLVTVAKEYLLCSESDIRRDRWGGGRSQLETLLGIKEQRGHDYFPASAYRGPFIQLLRYHPNEGISFIVDVFNHSADWYAHPKFGETFIEPPFEITLTFSDGTTRNQWCNSRLWNIYRGSSVSSNVLQCLLMALERWLLEVVKARPLDLESILLDILRRSDSAALTAVVASVATVAPQSAGEALLVLLRSKLCILHDRTRLGSESQSASAISNLFPRMNSKNMIYDGERKEADALPHRKHDLELAVLNLQMGPLRNRVQEILDQHREELPPIETQNEQDRVWRLTLHRMDLRQYSASLETPSVPTPQKDLQSSAEKKPRIRLDLQVPDADIKEMSEQSAAKFKSLNDNLGLSLWGQKVFAYEDEASYNPAQWRARLLAAREFADAELSDDERELAKGAPAFIAAVSIRDHWNDLTDDEKKWAAEIVCSEVEREGDNWNPYARIQNFSMGGDRPCASVVPILVGKPLPPALKERIQKALVVALTHANHQVRAYAAQGIGLYLWQTDRELTLRCVDTIALEAASIQQAADAEMDSPRPDRTPIIDIEANATKDVRRRFSEIGGIPPDAHKALNPLLWYEAEALGRILAILEHAPIEVAAIAAFKKLAVDLVKEWEAQDDRRNQPNEAHSERNYEAEITQTNSLVRFLMQASEAVGREILQPIAAAINNHSDKVQSLLISLIGVEDRHPNTSQFWTLWGILAAGVRTAVWLPRVDGEHSYGHSLISSIFLGTNWKPNVRHWRSLEGYADRIDTLFEDLPASSRVMNAYLRFLYEIGSRSLPEAFIRISGRLRQGTPRQMMSEKDSSFMLEVLLQRYVYRKPLELKRRDDLRLAVLHLLDILIEEGSSAAFRMRDDFVTPISNA